MRAWLLLLLGLLGGCALPLGPPPPTPDELIVTFLPEATEEAREASRLAHGAWEAHPLMADTELWRLEAGSAVPSPAPPLRFVQANHRWLLPIPEGATMAPRALSAPLGDPQFPRQWYLPLCHFPEAWRTSTGKGVIVAVLDSGVDPTHPDLRANLLPLVDELVALGLHDYLGDQDFDHRDGEGHGTIVCGLVGAVRGNGIGIAGAAPEASVLPIKVVGTGGQHNEAALIRGLADAVRLGARVVNLSLGSYDFSAALERAIAAAQAAQVVVVAAAGNDGREEPIYPASFPGVIAVAAADREGRPSPFSNRGPTIALAAPGGSSLGPVTSENGIYSTTPTYPIPIRNLAHPLTSSYGAQLGTSEAAPLVSAAAALLLSQHPHLSAAQVRARLLASASAPLAGYDERLGYGLLDAAAALHDPEAP